MNLFAGPRIQLIGALQQIYPTVEAMSANSAIGTLPWILAFPLRKHSKCSVYLVAAGKIRYIGLSNETP